MNEIITGIELRRVCGHITQKCIRTHKHVMHAWRKENRRSATFFLSFERAY